MGKKEQVPALELLSMSGGSIRISTLVRRPPQAKNIWGLAPYVDHGGTKPIQDYNE